MRMMRIPAVWTTNLVAFLFGVGMYSVFAFIPEFLQTPSTAGYGFTSDITDSGLVLAPLCVAMFIFGTISGRLSDRFGAKTILISGSVIAIPGYLILAFAHGAIWEILIATALLGIGIGLAFSAMSAIVVDAVPSHQTGVASGMNANIRTIGGSIGAAVMTSVVTADKLPTGLPKESGYTNGFGVLAAATIVAALAGLLIPKLKTARDEHQNEQAHLAHAELAIVAGGTIVGDESE
jgi:MFS family permease